MERLKAELVRCDAHSDNAQGKAIYQRDSASPGALRLIRQAMEQEQELV